MCGPVILYLNTVDEFESFTKTASYIFTELPLILFKAFTWRLLSYYYYDETQWSYLGETLKLEISIWSNFVDYWLKWEVGGMFYKFSFILFLAFTTQYEILTCP